MHPLQIVLFTEMFINQASANTFGGGVCPIPLLWIPTGESTVCCDRSRSSQIDTATLAFGLLFAVLLSVLLWPELSAQCPGTSRQKLRVFEPGSRWRDQGEKFLSSNEGSIIGGVVAVVCVAAGAIGFM